MKDVKQRNRRRRQCRRSQDHKRSVLAISAVVLLLTVMVSANSMTLKAKNREYQAQETELKEQIQAEKDRSEEIKELEKQMLQFENSTKQGDIKKIAEADVAFHDTIYHAAGNAKLVTMLDNMREQIYRYRVEYLKDENAYPTLIQEHRKILELLDKHEKEKVIEVMKVHVEKQAKVVKQIIRDQE